MRTNLRGEGVGPETNRQDKKHLPGGFILSVSNLRDDATVFMLSGIESHDTESHHGENTPG
jgi:hypothetical protein